MFVKESWRKVKGKIYKYYQLVESYRVNGKNKHRVIANISHLSKEEIHRLKLALGKKKTHKDLDNFFEKGYDYGNIAFWLCLMNGLGIFKVLKPVERIFRELKDLIEIKPVFHWKDRRVRTHIFLCIIAQSILRLCRVRLKDAGWFDDGSSMEDFMNFLNKIKLGQFNIDSVKVYKVQKLSERHKEILSRFGIKTIGFDVMKRQMIP